MVELLAHYVYPACVEAGACYALDYRDGLNREIDAVVELADGRWGAFEIKLGVNQIDAAADSLLSLKLDVEYGARAVPLRCSWSYAAFPRSPMRAPTAP